MDKSNDLSCNSYLSGKGSRFLFPSEAKNRYDVILGRVHSDLTTSEYSLSGKRYAITFVGEYSRKLWTRWLSNKSDASQTIKDFILSAQRCTGKNVLSFRSDNGGEYTSNELIKWVSSKRIRHERTTPYSPQQNGVAES